MDPTLVLGPVAALMAVSIALIVRWATHVRTVVAASVVLFLLAMMAAMLGAVVVYFSRPGPDAFVVGVWLAAGVMAVSVFPVFVLFLREAQRGITEGGTFRPRELQSPLGLAGGVTALVLGSELLMGRGFGLAAGTLAVGGSLLDQIAAIVASPWFLFPMSLEMTLTVAWLWHRLGGPLSVMMGGQAAMMFFAPPALLSTVWLAGSSVATSGAMTIVLVYLLRSAYRGRSLPAPVRSYAALFFGMTGLAAIGLAVWAIGGPVGLFSVGMAGEMVIFFLAAVAPERYGPKAGGRPPHDRGSPAPLGPAPAPLEEPPTGAARRSIDTEVG